MESASSGPESVLGQHCEVHFLEDREWYRAVVRGYDRTTKLHNLWYYFDEEVRIKHTCGLNKAWKLLSVHCQSQMTLS